MRYTNLRLLYFTLLYCTNSAYVSSCRLITDWVCLPSVLSFQQLQYLRTSIRGFVFFSPTLNHKKQSTELEFRHDCNAVDSPDLRHGKQSHRSGFSPLDSDGNFPRCRLFRSRCMRNMRHLDTVGRILQPSLLEIHAERRTVRRRNRTCKQKVVPKKC